MALFGGSWKDDEDEMDEQIGPLSHWDEDVDEDGNYSGVMANHYHKKYKEEIKDPGEKGADDNE